MNLDLGIGLDRDTSLVQSNPPPPGTGVSNLLLGDGTSNLLLGDGTSVLLLGE